MSTDKPLADSSGQILTMPGTKQGVLAADRPRKPIRVFRYGRHEMDKSVLIRPSYAYITLGAGETRVSVYDEDGGIDRVWTAVFGWQLLCDFELETAARKVTFDDEDFLARAMTGNIRLYGAEVCTRQFIADCDAHIHAGIFDILRQTIGTAGAAYEKVVLSIPEWLRPAMTSCLTIAPHFMIDEDN